MIALIIDAQATSECRRTHYALEMFISLFPSYSVVVVCIVSMEDKEIDSVF